MDNIIDASDSDIDSKLESNLPVMLFFSALWCGPCRMMAPVLDDIASQYEGKAVFVKLNSDDNPATCTKYSIRSIPTVLILKNGKVEGAIVGVKPKYVYVAELEKFI